MHINQQARLAANQLRKGRPNQGDRYRIAGILEDIATKFEEMEGKPEPVEPVIPDTVEEVPETQDDASNN
jgi:hypothetical protein